MLKELDLLGEVCPVPLMRAQEAARILTEGDELVLLIDFPRALRNVTQWSTRAGLPYEIEERPGGVWRITIRKTQTQ